MKKVLPITLGFNDLQTLFYLKINALQSKAFAKPFAEIKRLQAVFYSYMQAKKSKNYQGKFADNQ